MTDVLSPTYHQRRSKEDCGRIAPSGKHLYAMKDVTLPSERLVLFGGPAGAGKSTRMLSAHIQLDKIRRVIVGGLAEPESRRTLQCMQFRLSVRACCALSREFLTACPLGQRDGLSHVLVLEHLDQTGGPSHLNVYRAVAVSQPEGEPGAIGRKA